MEQEMVISGKTFLPFFSQEEIETGVTALAAEINRDYLGKNPLFVVVLNGAFMFASDLYKKITIESNISFVKLASYEGTETKGEVACLMGLNEDLSNRHVILVEDIVDTGHSIAACMDLLKAKNPLSIKICSLLFKPDAYRMDIPIDYTVKSIENVFVVGYGLDYNGYGRNIPQIYRLKS